MSIVQHTLPGYSLLPCLLACLHACLLIRLLTISLSLCSPQLSAGIGFHTKYITEGHTPSICCWVAASCCRHQMYATLLNCLVPFLSAALRAAIHRHHYCLFPCNSILNPVLPLGSVLLLPHSYCLLPCLACPSSRVPSCCLLAGYAADGME